MVATLRSIFRLIVFLISSLALVIFYGVGSIFTKNKDAWSLRLRGTWLHIIPKLLGLQATITGQPHEEAAIYVCNHRSYIDPVVITPYCKALVVVKADVHAWPLIGKAVKAVGVVFVKRESKQNRKAVRNSIKELVEQGQPILIFPEGTTSKSIQSLPFRPGTFMIAAEHNIPVVPIALEYEREEIAWIGKDLFFPHFMKIFGYKKINAKVRFGKAFHSNDWGTLLAEAQTWIDKQLLEMKE